MDFNVPGLTPRERQVAALVLKGLINKHIGDVLKISEQRVKNLRSAIYKKLRVTSPLELSRIMEKTTKHSLDDRYDRLIAIFDEDELIRWKKRAMLKGDVQLVRLIETEIYKRGR